MKTSVLKPGLLVSLKTTTRGGVNYKRIDLEVDHTTEEGSRVAKWETQREIPDPEEFERASAARGKARSLVASVCCVSSFGLLCPSEKEAELSAAVEEAREVARAHNAGATLTQVQVFVIVGRVAQDDAEAARAIAGEVRELLDAMRDGIKAADPAAIREAANKARALGAMLSEDVAGKVESAIEQARKAARKIVRGIEKDGLSAAEVVAFCNVQAIESARFAFLDLDAGEVKPEAPAARTLDLSTDSGPSAISAAPAPSYALEF